jgi:DNA polymerase-3 subunit alpha
MDLAARNRKDKELGQGSLFDALDDFEESEFSTVPIPDIPEFDDTEILNKEKELLGFYVSGHPAGKYADYFRAFSSHNVAAIVASSGEIGVKVGGILKSVSRKTSKKDGKNFAVIQFEDMTGSIECMAYPKTYEAFKEVIHLDERRRADAAAAGLPVPAVIPVVVKGVTRKNDENAPPTLIAEEILTLDDVMARDALELHIHFEDREEEKELLPKAKEILSRVPGKTKVVICIHYGEKTAFIETAESFNIAFSQSLAESLDALFGEKRCRFKADLTVPVPKVRYVPKVEEPAPGTEEEEN